MGDTGSMLHRAAARLCADLQPGAARPRLADRHPAYAAGTVNRYGAFIPLLVPAAILLIPYADLLMAVVRRTRAGKSVFAPDKKHLQHRLLAIGHSHRTSVLIMYLWAALFSASVVWLSIVRTPLYRPGHRHRARRCSPWPCCSCPCRGCGRGRVPPRRRRSRPGVRRPSRLPGRPPPSTPRPGPSSYGRPPWPSVARSPRRPSSGRSQPGPNSGKSGTGPGKGRNRPGPPAQEAAPWQADDPVSDNDAEPGQAFPWPVASATPPADARYALRGPRPMEDTQRDAFHRGDQPRPRYRPSLEDTGADPGDVAAAGQGHAPGAARAVRTRPVARVRPRRASRSSAVRSSAGWIPSAVGVIEASPGGIGASAVRAGVGPVRPAISRIQASGSRVGADRNNTVWTSAVRVERRTGPAGRQRQQRRSPRGRARLSASRPTGRAERISAQRVTLTPAQADRARPSAAPAGPAQAAAWAARRIRARDGAMAAPPGRPEAARPARRTAGDLGSGRRALVAVWLRKVAPSLWVTR